MGRSGVLVLDRFSSSISAGKIDSVDENFALLEIVKDEAIDFLRGLPSFPEIR